MKVRVVAAPHGSCLAIPHYKTTLPDAQDGGTVGNGKYWGDVVDSSALCNGGEAVVTEEPEEDEGLKFYRVKVNDRLDSRHGCSA
jgi:hypothetical protein